MLAEPTTARQHAATSNPPIPPPKYFKSSIAASTFSRICGNDNSRINPKTKTGAIKTNAVIAPNGVLRRKPAAMACRIVFGGCDVRESDVTADSVGKFIARILRDQVEQLAPHGSPTTAVSRRAFHN